VTSPKRLLLKLSGEAFAGKEGAFSPQALNYITDQITSLSGVELGIVVGGGNIIRGARSPLLDRVDADSLGMLATIMNGFALSTYLEEKGKETVIQSAVETELTDPIYPRKARKALGEGKIVIFVGGTGNPLVTTDTAAAVRAAAIRADLLAKGSNVAGVFTSDPAKRSESQLIEELSYDEFLAARYNVMDQVAVEICRENQLPIMVFNLSDPDALKSISQGKQVGTLIH
jgi:uridylate kinase